MDKNKFLIELSESSQTHFGRMEFATQSFPQKVFSAIWSLESEVNNGGFQQFFLNSDAEVTEFLTLALKTVGAKHTAEICYRAIEIAFPMGIPSNTNEIASISMNFDSKQLSDLEEVDHDFYGYSDDLTELLFAFVISHKDAFGIS
jgi:hypothetical protein